MKNIARLIAGGCLLIAMAETLLDAQSSSTTPAPQAKGTAQEKAADLLATINAIKFPAFDQTKRQDFAYVQKYSAEYQGAMARRIELSKKFINKYPDEPAAPNLALFVAETFREFHQGTTKVDQTASGKWVIDDREDRKEQLKMYRQIVAKYPGTDAAKAAEGPLRQVDDIGKPFKLSFTDAISGKKIDTAEMKGKVVVVDFWATWCGPCVGEMPDNKAIYDRYHDKGVEFIGVSLDAPESQGGLTRLRDFVAKNNIPWPQYYQGNKGKSGFSQYWGIQSIPTVFAIDTKGNLFSTTARGQLDTLIAQLLAPSAAR